MSVRAPLDDAHLFAAFRVLFGAYLTFYSLEMLPHAWEVFSREGMLPEPSHSPIATWFPRAALDLAPSTVRLLGIARVTLAASVGVGLLRRPAAAALWLLYAWEHQRNGFVTSPEYGYVGWLLLLLVFVPTGEPWAAARRDPSWSLPRFLRGAAWLVLGVSYTYSGLSKLGTPAWLDGTATRDALAQESVSRAWFFARRDGVPGTVYALMTWGSLATELFGVLWILPRRVRAVFWAASMGMHLGILATMTIPEVSLGMILFHVLLFEPRWGTRAFWRSSAP